jgi:hypothetical protein
VPEKLFQAFERSEDWARTSYVISSSLVVSRRLLAVCCITVMCQHFSGRRISLVFKAYL